MKSVENILLTIQADAESQLPSLISAAGLTAFEVFETEQSRDEDDIGFFVYQSTYAFQYDRNRCDIIIQLQLPGVTAIQAAKYLDVVFDWIKEYDLNRIDATLYEQVIANTWPPEQDETTFIIYQLIIIEELDSCDQ